MKKLTAVFLANLPSELFVQRLLPERPRYLLIGDLTNNAESNGEIENSTRDFLISLSLNYRAQINDFEVLIFLLPTSSWEQGTPDRETMFTVSMIQIEVSHAETIAPPELETHIDDSATLPARLEYFDERLPEYRKIALETINRIIHYFKYRLRNPLLNEFSEFQSSKVLNTQPIWKNELGQVIQSAYGANWTITIHFLPGELKALGRRNLSVNENEDLLHAIENPRSVELYEELRSSAQSAAVEGNLRRAVLELAVACEVIIYQTFFGESSPASEAFDFLVVEKYVQVAPKELIHKVAKRAFGESFQEKYKDDYTNIDNLFQCRNKVAHRGQLKYVAKEKSNDVDMKTFAQWWKSADILITWLNTLVAKSSS